MEDDYLAAALSVLPVGVFICQRGGYCVYINRAFLGSIGELDASTILGKSWLSIVHPDDQVPVSELWAKTCDDTFKLSAGPSMYRVRLRHHDGSYRRFDVNFVQMPGVHGSFIGTATDIEEVLRLAEEKQRAQYILGAVLSQLPRAVMVIDSSGSPLYHNPMMRLIWPSSDTGELSTLEEVKGCARHVDGRPVEPDEWPIIR